MQILKNDFFAIYEARAGGGEAALPTLDLQYKDFAEWQNKQLHTGASREDALDFWRKKISGGFPTLALPYDYQEDAKRDAGAGYYFMLGKELKDGLNQVALDFNSTLFVVMFTAYNALLAIVAKQEEIVCGIIHAGREHVSLKKIVGYFVSSLVVKNEVDPEGDFGDLLDRVNRNVLETFQYQAYPLEMVLDELQVPYPRVSAGFNMLNMQDDTREMERDGLQADHIENAGNAKFDINLVVMEYKNGIEVLLNYKKALFNLETIEYFVKGYRQILDNLLRD